MQNEKKTLILLSYFLYYNIIILIYCNFFRSLSLNIRRYYFRRIKLVTLLAHDFYVFLYRTTVP